MKNWSWLASGCIVGESSFGEIPFAPGPSYSVASWVGLKEEMDELVNDALNPSGSD